MASRERPLTVHTEIEEGLVVLSALLLGSIIEYEYYNTWLATKLRCDPVIETCQGTTNLMPWPTRVHLYHALLL